MQIIPIKTDDGTTSYEFIRWVCDAAGKTTPKILGRVAGGSRTIPDAILKQCTKEERFDLAHWLLSQMDGQGVRYVEELITAAPAKLAEIRAALTSNMATMEQLDVILHEVADIVEVIGRQRRRGEGPPAHVNGSAKASVPSPAPSLSAPFINIAGLLAVNEEVPPAPPPEPEEASLQMPSFLRALKLEPLIVHEDPPKDRPRRKP